MLALSRFFAVYLNPDMIQVRERSDYEGYLSSFTLDRNTRFCNHAAQTKISPSETLNNNLEAPATRPWITITQEQRMIFGCAVRKLDS